MKRMRKMLCAVCVAGCVLMGSAAGAITYVDAELDNTTIDGAALVLGDNYTITPDHSLIDGLWGFRTNRSDTAGEGIWVSDGGAAAGEVDRESTAALKVDVTLPDAGIYDLYAVIMNNNTGTGYWDVATRIGDTGDFTNFNKNSAEMTLAVAADFDSAVNISTATSGDQTFKVLIGQYTATTAGETISIYVNGLDSWDGQAGLDQRTRFDGLGYEAVPEPITLVLLSAGAFLGLRRRK